MLPDDGPAAGGNMVRFLGLGLSDATSVLFGSGSATMVAGNPFAGPTITVMVPAHGVMPVTVITSSGKSNSVSCT